MIQSKWVPWIAGALIVFLTIGIFVLGSNWMPQENDRVEPEYVSKLFLDDVITIDITVDEEKWQSMLDNATAEEFIPCDITVAGETFSTVGIRPKGNSSLTMVAGSDSDRYSFRLSFDEYIDGQTCFGLDQMVLNNAQSDYTMMKDFICYDLMSYMGVDAPLKTYANVMLNGKQWGIYLAVELYNDSFLERVYGTSAGNLYNVKMSMGGAGGGARPEMNEEEMEKFREAAKNGQMPQPPDGGDGNFGPPPDGMVPPAQQGASQAQSDTARQEQKNQQNMPQQEENLTQGQEPQATTQRRGGMGGGMPGSRGGGGDLVYNGDDADSYSSIFENAVGKSSASDQSRMMEAILHLNSGEDLETYWNVDKALRYLAVHTFVVNLDSYTSSMQQNYYLYEKDGCVTVLPWDYNLAFGGFMGGNASSAVNFPVDTPVSGVEMDERPLINTLLQNEEYRARYHAYLQEICEKYVTGGVLESTVARIRKAIDAYVDSDPTKFCTTEQYQAATEALITFCKLRAESVTGQLEGTIPSTTEGQSADTSTLVAVDSTIVQTMGRQGGGHDRGMRKNQQNTDAAGSSDIAQGNTAGKGQAGRTNPADDASSAHGNENMPSAPPDITGDGDAQATQNQDEANGVDSSADASAGSNARQNAGNQFAGRGGPPGMGNQKTASFDIMDWIPTIAGIVLLVAALAVAMKWKRKY